MCQIWDGHENQSIQTPFSRWPGSTPLALYNKRPTALNEESNFINSYYFGPESEWLTVATLDYKLRTISVVSLDSGDLLIIGYPENAYGLPPEIIKLHNGNITRLGELDKVP